MKDQVVERIPVKAKEEKSVKRASTIFDYFFFKLFEETKYSLS